MTESKKAWVAPELIVLVRNNPEEAVLGVCKTGLVGVDPNLNVQRCYGSAIESCFACNVTEGS